MTPEAHRRGSGTTIFHSILCRLRVNVDTASGRKRVILVLLSSYCVFLVWLLFLHVTYVVVTAEMHTERVSFKVISPRNAAFLVTGMRGGTAGQVPSSKLLQGLFEPNSQSEVVFGRSGMGSVEIDVSPPSSGAAEALAGTLDRDDGSERKKFFGQTHFEVSPILDSNHPIAPQFAIWGEAKIGEVMHPLGSAGPAEPSLLIDGTLKISARSLIFDSLYPVTSITVPVGAEIGMPRNRRRDVLWWGMAYVDPQRTALVAELSTEAPVIAVQRPNRSTAEMIRVSGLAQLFDDPDVLWMHFALSVLVFVLTNFAQVRELLK